MQLNSEKPEVMNTKFSYRLKYEQDVVIDNRSVSPNAYTKFLGVLKKKLSLNKRVDL